MTSKAESTDRKPVSEDWFKKEITRNFEEIGEPDIWFRFRTPQNMPWEENEEFLAGLRSLSNRTGEENDKGLANAHLKRVVVDWNIPDVETDERLPIPSETEEIIVGRIRVRHVEYMIHVLGEISLLNPLLDLV
jgi:hypothetical protein